MKQTSSASATHVHKKIITKREKFLNEMDQVIPWQRWLTIIEPYYPKKGRGRPPMPMESMLRIYCLQQWYNLSDPGAEEALYDMESMRRFAKLALGKDALPDETTILNFRRMMEAHQLSEALFKDVNAYLKEQGIRVSQGSMVDATIVHAPSSTKNRQKKRDDEMSSTRKGNQYYFGMKIHIGTDVNSNVVHTATVTSANEADITELPNLIRKDDQVIFADAGYTSDSYKRGARALGMSWRVNDKRKPKKNMSSSQKKRNRQNSSIRARAEHIFRVVKGQFGYRKTRYQGLEKNRVQVLSLLSLTNIYLQRRHLMG